MLKDSIYYLHNITFNITGTKFFFVGKSRFFVDNYV